MKKIMMIGYGAMAKEVIARLPEGVKVGWILARAAHHAAIAEAFGGRVQALTHPEQCSQRPDLVLECASQQAVAEFGEAVLQRGWPLAVISTGA
ncbi:aspartate dehydrogenase, partial [Serratia marcescens]